MSQNSFAKRPYILALRAHRKAGIITQAAEHVGFAVGCFADNTTGQCHPGHDAIGKIASTCARHVRRCLAQLRAIGFLDWIATKEGGKNVANVYTLRVPDLPSVSTKKDGRALRAQALDKVVAVAKQAIRHVGNIVSATVAKLKNNKEEDISFREGSADKESGPTPEVVPKSSTVSPQVYPQLEAALSGLGQAVADRSNPNSSVKNGSATYLSRNSLDAVRGWSDPLIADG